MTKKILLLVLSLPLILMLCLFTTSNTISLAISIPVTGIEITSDKIVYLDMDKNEIHKVEYIVFPTNSGNKNVSFSTEEVAGEKYASLEYINGKIVPKSSGVAKVFLTTVDGGFKDSFIVYVNSTKIQGINSTIEKTEIYIGDETQIKNEFVPAETKDKLLEYTSSDENVAKVDANGVVYGISSGKATITIKSTSNNSVYDTVMITVLSKDGLNIAPKNTKTWNVKGSVNLEVSKNIEYKTIEYRFLDEQGKEYKQSPFREFKIESIGSNKYIVNYEFTEGFVGVVNIEYTLKSLLDMVIETETCQIEKVDEVNIEFNYSEIPSFVQGVEDVLLYKLTPQDALNDKNVRIEFSTNNENVLLEKRVGNVITIKALKAGVTTVTLTLIDGDSTKSISTDVVIKPNSFIIEETANTYGDEQLLTIGRNDIFNQVSKFKFNVTFGKTELGSNFYENIKWVTSNPLVKVEDGELSIIDPLLNEIVEIKVVYEYQTFKIETGVFKIRCIGNGINVYSYQDLLEASKEELPIILHKDIVEDFGKDRNGNKMNIKDVYTEIQTTYDNTYFKNLEALYPNKYSAEELSKIKVLLSFKADVYGNGYVVNAHNLSYQCDSTGALLSDALFRGPLNFVAVTETGASAVSVKGQDNICFALYEGASLNNIQLKGCTLQSDSNNSYDLTDLNYVGTVVEVLGDNVEVNYSRISNGRTVMRIFGDINDSSKIINVNINNSVLTVAREFILRMGSNHYVQGTKENNSPYLDSNTKLSFPVYVEYKHKTEEQKQQYDESYIKTFVTVKNCAFKDCGIFAIALDSHFSGELLANAKNYVENSQSLSQLKELFNPWYDLAKTSYGAKLIFEGEVRIYDWKKLENVDSSTLIDISLKGGSFDNIFERLTFDVKQLVNIASQKQQFKNIVYTDTKGTKYVHGGIAFFGGGKNYSCFEDRTNNAFETLNGYEINLSDVESSYLNLAAGNESFYFLIYDATTLNFLPEKQEEYLSSDSSAYDFVFKK